MKTKHNTLKTIIYDELVCVFLTTKFEIRFRTNFAAHRLRDIVLTTNPSIINGPSKTEKKNYALSRFHFVLEFEMCCAWTHGLTPAA